MLLLKFILFLALLSKFECFIPAKLMERAISVADEVITLTKASDSLTHEAIIRKGISQAVVRYFYDRSVEEGQPDKINLTRIDSDYYELTNLYYDYYGIWFCKIHLEEVIDKEFEKSVSSVDFNKLTKDLPYAHFDAETFQKSNDRVIEFTNNIYAQLSAKNYKQARKLAGEVLHTIHDFYSHSNWVEMGRTDINKNIGQPGMNGQTIASKNDSIACSSNCTQVNINCNFALRVFVLFLKTVGFRSSAVKCPIRYFICRTNTLIKDKLISGYYSNQKLPDGSAFDKPTNLIKCSHGGIMDDSSFRPAIGGINKDSGFYMFSPHAFLHLKAADLAIKHTAYYFNEIRAKIGNQEFANFLKLDEMPNIIGKRVIETMQICSGCLIKSNLINLFIFLIISILFNI